MSPERGVAFFEIQHYFNSKDWREALAAGAQEDIKTINIAVVTTMI